MRNAQSPSSAAEWLYASDAAYSAASASRAESPPSANPALGGTWGPFRIETELGRGGHAKVYRVRIGDSEPLALKVLLQPTARSRQRLAREARLVGGLDHPGIVQLRGAGEVAGTAFLLYALVPEARTLNAYWVNLDTRARVGLVRQVAQAVGHAHTRGVLHRDLKPANVLVDASGDPRVVDFGLATHSEVSPLTQSGAWVGTPSYMAPEQFDVHREHQAPMVDVWSLGVLLYEALTERLPFHGGTTIQLAQRVIDANPTPIRQLNPTVPSAIQAVCLRALSKNPQARYTDATAFASALHSALATRSARKVPLWAWLSPALALLLGGLVWATVSKREPRGTKPPPQPAERSPFADTSVMDALDRLGPEATRERALAWLEVEPGDVKARLALSSAFARLRDWERAIPLARDVLKERPQHLLALEILAISEHGRGRISAAQEYCDRGLDLDPSRPRLWRVRSMLAAYYGQNEESLEAARRGLELAPNDSEALSTYALTLSSVGQDELALDYYDRSLSLKHDEDTQFNRAISLGRVGRHAEAIAVADALIQADPDDVSNQCLRVTVLSRLDPAAALLAAEDLEVRYPESPRALHTCASIYRHFKRYAKARECYRASLALEPAGQFARMCRKALEKLEGR